MPIELRLLVWSAALALVQMLAAMVCASSQVGLAALVGNRHELPALTGVAQRASRAHLNMLESLLVFAIAVLVAQAMNRFNATTALGAMLFFWGRIAHGVVYLIGIAWLRTIIWACSTIGILLVLSSVF